MEKELISNLIEFINSVSLNELKNFTSDAGEQVLLMMGFDNEIKQTVLKPEHTDNEKIVILCSLILDFQQNIEKSNLLPDALKDKIIDSLFNYYNNSSSDEKLVKYVPKDDKSSGELIILVEKNAPVDIFMDDLTDKNAKIIYLCGVVGSY